MAEKDSSPTQKGGPIKDARGRKVPQLDTVAMHLLRRRVVVPSDVLQAIANEKGVRPTRVERAALIGGVCGALLAISFLMHALITGVIRDAPFLTGLIYLCCLPWIMWYNIKKKRFGKVAAAMLKHLHCPHCGYDIRGLPIDPEDGATVCPECGCAWRLDDRRIAGGQDK